MDFDGNLKCVFCYEKFVECNVLTFNFINCFKCVKCNYIADYNFDVISQQFIFYRAYKYTKDKKYMLEWNDNSTRVNIQKIFGKITGYVFFKQIHEFYKLYSDEELENLIESLIFL